MKTILIALLLLASTAFASDFCSGWHAGYIAGFCDNKPYCVAPTVPICPTPRINEHTYQHGYNRGFVAGSQRR